jgi:hypothetical protein
MSFNEFYIRNVAGNIKTIILTLEKKDESEKKLLMEVEIKTKKILRVVALNKKGVKYMFCIDGKIKYLPLKVVL